MDIKRAKQEIKDSVEAYLNKNEYGEYRIPALRQRPVLLMGPPGIGKTQIMEQIAKECGIGLVAYTITHHTRQSAVGLPFIKEKTYGGVSYSVTEYTMSEIILRHRPRRRHRRPYPAGGAARPFVGRRRALPAGGPVLRRGRRAVRRLSARAAPRVAPPGKGSSVRAGGRGRPCVRGYRAGMRLAGAQYYDVLHSER